MGNLNNYLKKEISCEQVYGQELKELKKTRFFVSENQKRILNNIYKSRDIVHWKHVKLFYNECMKKRAEKFDIHDMEWIPENAMICCEQLDSYKSPILTGILFYHNYQKICMILSGKGHVVAIINAKNDNHKQWAKKWVNKKCSEFEFFDLPELVENIPLITSGE